MLISELKQLQLAKIHPKGTTDLPIQLEYRQKISEQWDRLIKIHSLPLSVQKKPIKKKELSIFLKENGFDRFGITAINDNFKYTNNYLTEKDKIGIVVVMPMKYEEMMNVPSYSSAIEIFRCYYEVGEMVVKLTEFIKQHGHYAFGHHPLGLKDYHQLLMPPFAYYAGLGEQGRTGIFIDHKYGPLIRLGMVTTDLDLEVGHPIEKGINAFCKRCVYCAKYCPPKAISFNRYETELYEDKKIKFTIDGDKCIKYFEKHFGCGRCIFHCVLTKNNTQEIEKRMLRIENWYNQWVVSGKLKDMFENETMKLQVSQKSV